ncbi:MAG: UDP-N-acetylmuramoyl-L-alanyl-D-glutamate--2,6-diaminopimelate ligase [Deltaproteobacteria bacterium]|nr:MAG: UDP-N-acetylmuramoyl-L-alanyl-D-glutamate--2,6-diaminopimelate ligase [Deltaproteobacteria bacterium]
MHEIGEAARSIVMMLGTLIDGLAGARIIGDANTPVRAVRSDSRAVEPGDVYVAIRGIRADGHTFVPAAIERGAAAVVVEHPLEVAVPQVIVPDGAIALGVLAGRALGDPARAMTLIGVTGTNGKTTTTHLVESLLVAAGARPGLIGTVEYRWRGPGGEPRQVDAPYTTPTPQVLHETFAAMRADGTTHVVMEVSSFALSMARVAGLSFAVGAFSNLTQDHLDVHGSMAEYRAVKRRLFSDHLAGPGGAGTAVINIDDPEGETMASAAPGRVLRVSAEGRPADIRVVEQHSTVRGITARIAAPRGELAVEARPLIGHYNVANLALAVGIGEALGLPHEAIARGIAGLGGVPGRVERVANDADLDIFVDYAHTPDALRNVLSALRPLTRRRLICVFGCGGDRDPTKRPKMGAEVAGLADLAVVTSDNPRTEDPRAIIDQILAGVPRPFAVDVDRARAIRAAISEAVPGDIVVIAGKGHEDYQILGTTKHHFDDREQAAAAVGLRESRALSELAHDAGGQLAGADDAIHRVVIDSRIAAPGDLYVAIRGETHDGHAFCAAAVAAGARGVMVERTVDVTAPSRRGASPVGSITVADTRIALGELARAHRRRWRGRLIAITGSAGKTTTKELTRAALAFAGPTHAADGSLNNETGVPLTVLGLRAFHAYGVIEMGMRGAGQIEYLTRIAEPDVAVVINAGTAHLELLGSTDAIAAAKSEIWLGLRDGGTIVRPAGDDRLAVWARRHRPDARQLTFGEPGADVALVGYRATDAGGELEIEVLGRRHQLHLGLVGRHAALDACAAIAAAVAAQTGAAAASDASIDLALRGVARARPPAMRGEIVEVAGRKLIVDCYNANPASMTAALHALAERAHGPHGDAHDRGHGHAAHPSAIAVLGDMLELGDHGPAAHRAIGELARELHVGVVALGALGAAIAETAGGELAATPADAAARALARTRPGDWILLKASRGMRLERVLDALKAVT